MDNKIIGSTYSLSTLILLLMVVFACAQQQPQHTAEQQASKIPAPEAGNKSIIEKEAAVQPELYPVLKILYPKDKDTIKSSRIAVQVDAENFRIVPIGEPVRKGEGHFHVWLDSDKKVTADKTVIFEDVASGSHTIVAELVKSNHSSLSPRTAKTITINVESDFKPKTLQPQAALSEFIVEADDHGFYPNKIQAKIGDTVKISFKFRDDSIYFAGLDITGPFPTIKYKLKGEQPLAAEFTMKGETKIISYWPSSGVKKAELIVEVEK